MRICGSLKESVGIYDDLYYFVVCFAFKLRVFINNCKAVFSDAFHFNPEFFLYALYFEVHPKDNCQPTNSPTTNFDIYQSFPLMQLGRAVSRVWISSPIVARL